MFSGNGKGELKSFLLDIGKTYAGGRVSETLQKVGVTRETAETLVTRLFKRPAPPQPVIRPMERFVESPWVIPIAVGGVGLVLLWFIFRR